MKKLIAVLITLFAIWSISCEKLYGPDYEHDGVYILKEKELTRVHGITFEMPSTTNTLDLQLVSRGITRLEILNKSKNISAELISDFSCKDAIVYDTLYLPSNGDYIARPRYVQTVRVISDAGSKKQSRKITFRIHTQNGVPEYADMTVRQGN